MKILFVINGLGTGGAERSLAESLPYLRAAGVEPVVACFYRRSQGVQGQILASDTRVHFITDRRLASRILQLRSLLRSERPDLVHTALFEADIAGRLATAGLRIPLLTSLISTPYATVRLRDPRIDPVKLRLVKMIDGWTARRLTTHFHAVSNAAKDAAVRDLQVPPRKISVIERGRDPDRLGPPSPERRALARSRLNLNQDERVLVNVGRQEFQKGQIYLLRALDALTARLPKPMVLIAGRDGNATNELIQYCEQRELSDRVRFLGHRDDIGDILAAADIFAFPSLFEGMPGAVIEAMALALPVIATRIEPVCEVVEEGKNALLVEPAAVDPLSRAIDGLFSSPDTMMKFGTRSRELFLERFVLERVMAKTLALYQEVAQKR
jgi:glycosyltransferase involved in cell wall biosynthesis